MGVGGWGGGGGGINDGANGCAVETVEPDGTASLSSVFITLQGTEGERQGAVSATHPLHPPASASTSPAPSASPLPARRPANPDTLLLETYLRVGSGHSLTAVCLHSYLCGDIFT